MTASWAGRLVALLAGLVFSAGLLLSGMTRPEKVIGFLDVAGRWDPSLLCVMAGAIAVHLTVYRLTLRRTAPLLSSQFWLPTRRDIDRPLLVGAVVFGAGWGLGGYCPGPALVALPYGGVSALVFVLAMLVGMLAAAGLERAFPSLGDPAPGRHGSA